MWGVYSLLWDTVYRFQLLVICLLLSVIIGIGPEKKTLAGPDSSLL